MFDSVPRTLRNGAASAAAKIGIDWETYKIILKTTIAPAIGLAANQAIPWSSVFGQLGFIVPMASIILHPSPPRATFVRDLLANLVGFFLSAAVTALAVFCVVKAREQSITRLVKPDEAPYNADASAVAAIWLIVQTYVISAVRYNYPWLIWTASACLIFSNYGMVYAVQFKNMTEGYTFLRELLWVHLVGFGISTGVALFILPKSCREPFFKTASDCTKEIRSALQTYQTLMKSIVQDSLIPQEVNTARKSHKEKLDALLSKLATEVTDAQKECAWTALSGADLSTLTHLLEDTIIPSVSLCQSLDVREAVLHAAAENHIPEEGEKAQDPGSSFREFQELLGSVLDTFSRACTSVDMGIQYVEAVTRIGGPGSAGNNAEVEMAYPEAELERAMALLVESKADLKNALDERLNSKHSNGASFPQDPSHEEGNQTSVNLYMVLYTELLLWSLLRSTRSTLLWSRQLETSHILKKKRLVVPQLAFTGSLGRMFRQSKGAGREDRPIQSTVYIRPTRGRSFSQRMIACIVQLLRAASKFFASPASGFGLRVTCATMCSAIVCFLPSSQDFYIKQHLVWVQYTISFTMQGSAGQSIRTLVFRIGGTIIAACLSWVSWYIVVGIPAGVLVFYWLSMHVPMYIMATTPRFYNVGTVSAFALTSILGNVLQPDESAASHSTLVLGAIRLAAISTGCLIGTIWTIFPFPASDHDGAKDKLSVCLASLAEYHTVSHDIVEIRVKEALGQSAPSREHDLAELDSRLFSKCSAHLQALRSKLKLTKWNFRLDEHFPRRLYESACAKIDGLMRNMQLIVHASQALLDFLSTRPPGTSSASSSSPTDGDGNGFGVAALLSLLSYSIHTETPLPLNLKPPSAGQIMESFDITVRLSQQVKSIRDPGAGTFGLLQIGTTGMNRDLVELSKIIRDIVGERNCRLDEGNGYL